MRIHLIILAYIALGIAAAAVRIASTRPVVGAFIPTTVQGAREGTEPGSWVLETQTGRVCWSEVKREPYCFR